MCTGERIRTHVTIYQGGIESGLIREYIRQSVQEVQSPAQQGGESWNEQKVGRSPCEYKSSTVPRTIHINACNVH